MINPPNMAPDGCFSNNNPPRNPEEAIDRIAQMVGLTVVNQGGKFDDSTFKKSPRDTWADSWGQWARKHFTPKAWEAEWRNVAVIATVHGCRAADYAKERGHQNGVTEQDFLDAGAFASHCCKECYFKSFGMKEACWCVDC